MRKKGKFVYNPQTLKYERVEIRWQTKFLRLFSFFLSALALAAIIYTVGYQYFELPGEVIMKRKLRNLEDKYKTLSKRANLMDTVLKKFEDRDNNIYRVIFEAEPRDIRVPNTNPYSEFENASFSTLANNIDGKLHEIEHRIYKQSLSYDTLYTLARTQHHYLQSIPSIPPVNLRLLHSRMSGFGMRMHPIYKTMRMHTGVDMPAKIGTPIYATGDGRVVSAGWFGGYGKAVIIDHGFGYKTLYGHMSSLKVTRWQRVNRGQLIGLMGSTGVSTGPHLHYEVIKNGKPVNPVNYFFADLTTKEYEEILQQMETTDQSFD